MWVGKEQVIQLLSGIVAIEGYLRFEPAVSISISACYSFINRGCHDELGKRGQNVSLSYSIGGAN
jgi:hypothetical protein